MKSLKKLAIKHKTDKHGIHFYTEIYEKFMQSSINKKIKLLEIGVGGYENPIKGGESLRMWSDYFKRGKIFGLDYFKKKIYLGKKIKIFQGSQTNKKDLSRIIRKTGKLDFIIDDGSHINKDVIYTFKNLFRYLKNGGYYFIEDTQTAYISRFGGDGFFLKNNKTSINFFKTIIDKINYMEIENPFYNPDYFAKNIVEIHFYHNLIVIKKNPNLEESNINDIKKKNKKKLKILLLLFKSLINNLIDKIKL